jgi:hypothetical protein
MTKNVAGVVPPPCAGDRFAAKGRLVALAHSPGLITPSIVAVLAPPRTTLGSWALAGNAALRIAVISTATNIRNRVFLISLLLTKIFVELALTHTVSTLGLEESLGEFIAT